MNITRFGGICRANSARSREAYNLFNFYPTKVKKEVS